MAISLSSLFYLCDRCFCVSSNYCRYYHVCSGSFLAGPWNGSVARRIDDDNGHQARPRTSSMKFAGPRRLRQSPGRRPTAVVSLVPLSLRLVLGRRGGVANAAGSIVIQWDVVSGDPDGTPAERESSPTCFRACGPGRLGEGGKCHAYAIRRITALRQRRLPSRSFCRGSPRAGPEEPRRHRR